MQNRYRLTLATDVVPDESVRQDLRAAVEAFAVSELQGTKISASERTGSWILETIFWAGRLIASYYGTRALEEAHEMIESSSLDQADAGDRGDAEAPGGGLITSQPHGLEVPTAGVTLDVGSMIHLKLYADQVVGQPVTLKFASDEPNLANKYLVMTVRDSDDGTPAVIFQTFNDEERKNQYLHQG